jgi:DNA-binding transcriptional ArsR family regulator
MKTKLLLSIHEEPIQLLNRTQLKNLKESIMNKMNDAEMGTVFVLDMSNIGDTNGSGIDEVIAKPLKWLINEFIEKKVEKYIYLVNLSPEEEHDHAYNIDSTLNIEQLCIMAKAEESFSILGYLGGSKGSLKEILEFVYTRKEVTARDVVDVFDKQINTASTQLSKLYEKRLIAREEIQMPEGGGRQFVYKSLF